MVEVTIPKCKFWPVCTGQQTMWNNTQENSSRPRRFSIAEKAHGIVDSKGKKTSGAKHFISKLLFELLSFMNSDVMRLNFFKIPNSINNIWRYFLITIGKSNGRGGESKYFPLTSEGGVRKSRWPQEPSWWPPTTIPLPRPTPHSHWSEEMQRRWRDATKIRTLLQYAPWSETRYLRFVFGGRSLGHQFSSAQPSLRMNGTFWPQCLGGVWALSQTKMAVHWMRSTCVILLTERMRRRKGEKVGEGEKKVKVFVKLWRAYLLMDRLVRFSGA